MGEMLSLETAIKLKEAGLEWEPKEGDYILYPDGELTSILTCGDVAFEDLEGCVFAPRLDQLLTEIEKRKHDYRLQANQSSDIYLYKIRVWYGAGYSWDFIGRNLDETAALALLWILTEGGHRR